MNKYYFREFVDTLAVALRKIEQVESPVHHIHPVILRDDSPRDPGMKPGEQGM